MCIKKGHDHAIWRCDPYDSMLLELVPPQQGISYVLDGNLFGLSLSVSVYKNRT